MHYSLFIIWNYCQNHINSLEATIHLFVVLLSYIPERFTDGVFKAGTTENQKYPQCNWDHRYIKFQLKNYFSAQIRPFAVYLFHRKNNKTYICAADGGLNQCLSPKTIKYCSIKRTFEQTPSSLRKRLMTDLFFILKADSGRNLHDVFT